MKILAITNCSQEPTTIEELQVISIPDSSLIKDGKPMFLPDLTRDYALAPFIALRLCKVGKHIAPRFAHRYCNAYAIGVNLIDTARLEHARQHGLPWSGACTCDASVAVSSFVETDFSQQPTVMYNINFGEMPLYATQFCFDNIARTLLSKISEQYTFKIGDLILLQHHTDNLTLKAVKDTNVRGFISDTAADAIKQEILDFNIK
jgi:2-keto-4-pentenoate hydratase/2-oxohepta-3-ene-1,7-dioic acid hydratase in catechol pathway